MRYTPKRSGRAADAICLAFFGCAAVLSWANIVASGYKTVFQIPAIIFLTAAIFTLVRYKLMGYNYVIKTRNSDDVGIYTVADIDFAVEKIQGKRLWTECRVSLDDMIEITKIPREKRNVRIQKDIRITLKEHTENVKLFYYTVNIFPPDPYLMLFKDPGDTSEKACIGIIFEPDSNMVEQIKSLANKEI